MRVRPLAFRHMRQIKLNDFFDYRGREYSVCAIYQPSGIKGPVATVMSYQNDKDRNSWFWLDANDKNIINGQWMTENEDS